MSVLWIYMYPDHSVVNTKSHIAICGRVTEEQKSKYERIYIMKTLLFKYLENFTSKKLKIFR